MKIIEEFKFEQGIPKNEISYQEAVVKLNSMNKVKPKLML